MTLKEVSENKKPIIASRLPTMITKQLATNNETLTITIIFLLEEKKQINFL